MSSSETMQQ